MINKKATILAILLIGLLAVGITSAADSSTSDVVSVESTINETVSVEDTNLDTGADDIEKLSLSSSANDDGSNNSEINKIGSADVKTAKKYDDEILQASDKIVYVNGSVETSGNGSIESPFKTLSEALNVAFSGYTIKIAPGEYNGSNNTNLTIKTPLNFEKYGDGEAIFDAQGNGRIWNMAYGQVFNIIGLLLRMEMLLMGVQFSLQDLWIQL